MSDLPTLATLQSWMQNVDRQLRDLAIGNPLDRGSVQDAAGNNVLISSLAFGQVADLWPGVGVMDVPGALNSTGPGWTYTAKPTVTVLVRGGRLRVDWSALLALLGGGAPTTTAAQFAAAWVYSYRLMYLGPENARGSVNQQVVGPDYYRALSIRDMSGSGTYLQAANWAMHTDLTPGWYQVQPAWLFSYTSQPVGTPPHAYADNPRIAATPY